MAETATADRPGSGGLTEGGLLKAWSGWDYVPGIAFLVVGPVASQVSMSCCVHEPAVR